VGLGASLGVFWGLLFGLLLQPCAPVIRPYAALGHVLLLEGGLIYRAAFFDRSNYGHQIEILRSECPNIL